MYTIKEETLEKLSMYVSKKIAEEVGIHEHTVSLIKNRKKSSLSRQTAYCLTKFLDGDAKVEDFFIKED